MSLAALLVLTGVWSLAEATLWFIVADVPISWIALRFGLRPALLAALIASVTSAAGGAVAYIWADHDPAGATAAMALLPAISPAMIGQAASAYAADGWRAMLEASFSGTPYKLFALAAARDGHDLLHLLLATPPVRFPRFALVALLAFGGSKLLERHASLRPRLALLVALWLLFYAAYFAMMPA